MTEYGTNVVHRLDRTDQGVVLGAARRDAATTGAELIKYDLCVEGDVDPMCDLLAEVFSRSDPPAVAAGLTALEFRAFVQLLRPKANGERLTIVARLADSSKVVGALLTEDGSSSLPDGVERLSQKLDPIFDILGQLGAVLSPIPQVCPQGVFSDAFARKRESLVGSLFLP